MQSVILCQLAAIKSTFTPATMSPSSFSTTHQDPKKQSSSSRLFHPLLEDIPLPVRFVISGVTGNAIFLILYNTALHSFQSIYDAGTIFAVVQFGCIILNHWLNVGIVFGFPTNYLSSLASNMPVGLTSLALGAWLANACAHVQLDQRVREWMIGSTTTVTDNNNDDAGGLASSVVVMAVTGIFNYTVLNLINSNSNNDSNDTNNSQPESKKDL